MIDWFRDLYSQVVRDLSYCGKSWGRVWCCNYYLVGSLKHGVSKWNSEVEGRQPSGIAIYIFCAKDMIFESAVTNTQAVIYLPYFMRPLYIPLAAIAEKSHHVANFGMRSRQSGLKGESQRSEPFSIRQDVPSSSQSSPHFRISTKETS